MDSFNKQDFITRMQKGETADEIKEQFLTTLRMAEREYNRSCTSAPSVSHEIVYSYYPMLHKHTITFII